MKHLDLPFREMDIRPLCFELMKAMGHRPFGIPLDSLGVQEFIERLKEIPPEKREDLLFENLQARLRTQILMNAGFMVGTGDLSELALGFCTYGGDHMSMYNPNAGVPKTLVRFLIRWMKEKIYRDNPLAQTLDAILETPITPELLPLAGEVQQTERIIGPYELHDFFLYYLLRFGYSPRKIFFLARQARFSKSYSPEELLHWLKLFLTRFFAHQYKRSVLPDGPKVGSVSLSPRGDFRMPSDLSADLWLKELEELSC
jgi:NAD+ synthase (glutamine-hydrolysing)